MIAVSPLVDCRATRSSRAMFGPRIWGLTWKRHSGRQCLTSRTVREALHGHRHLRESRVRPAGPGSEPRPGPERRYPRRRGPRLLGCPQPSRGTQRLLPQPQLLSTVRRKDRLRSSPWKALLAEDEVRFFLDPQQSAVLALFEGSHGSYQIVLAVELEGSFLQLNTIRYAQCPTTHPHCRERCLSCSDTSTTATGRPSSAGTPGMARLSASSTCGSRTPP